MKVGERVAPDVAIAERYTQLMLSYIATFQPHLRNGHAHSTPGASSKSNSKLHTSSTKRQTRTAVLLQASFEF